MRYHPNHPPCPGPCGMLADECECHRQPRDRSVALAGQATVCRDAAPASQCGGPVKYAGRCGKHAARARRARVA